MNRITVIPKLGERAIQETDSRHSSFFALYAVVSIGLASLSLPESASMSFGASKPAIDRQVWRPTASPPMADGGHELAGGGRIGANPGKSKSQNQTPRAKIRHPPFWRSQVIVSTELATSSFLAAVRTRRRQNWKSGRNSCQVNATDRTAGSLVQEMDLIFAIASRLANDGYVTRCALATDDAPHFSSFDQGIVGYKARQNLAVVYVEMGTMHKAEEV